MPAVRLPLRYHLMVIFSLLLWSATLAQPDHCRVQVDKSFYVTGEVIWFQLWLPAAYSARPAAILVQIIRPAGSVAGQFFLPAAGGSADGYFRVPFEWPSGMYRLRFSASLLPEAASLELAMVTIPVFSDLENVSVSQEPLLASPVTTEEAFGDLPLLVRVTPDREVYHPRDSVRLVVEVTEASGRPAPAQLTVAVTDQLLCGPQVYPGPVLFSGPPLPRGGALDSLIVLKGSIRDSLGRPFSSPLLTAWLSPPAVGTIAATDDAGAFLARLPLFWGQGAVQLFDFKQDGLRAAAEPARSFPAAPPLRYSEGVLRYLESSRQRKKIYQLFDTLESVPVPLPVPASAPLREPDRRLAPADYEGLTTVADFFRELPTQLSFRQRQGAYVARMFNPEPHMKKDYGGPPLFIIDGRLTRDADFIAALNLSDIEAIDLYFDYAHLRENFGAIGRYGVVDIRTKSRTISLPETDRQNFIPLSGLLPPAVFPRMAPADLDNPSTLPAFRPQVFWAPAIPTDASGRTTLSFSLGDDLSRFRIFVTARTSDGRLGAGEVVIEAK